MYLYLIMQQHEVPGTELSSQRKLLWHGRLLLESALDCATSRNLVLRRATLLNALILLSSVSHHVEYEAQDYQPYGGHSYDSTGAGTDHA